ACAFYRDWNVLPLQVVVEVQVGRAINLKGTIFSKRSLGKSSLGSGFRWRSCVWCHCRRRCLVAGHIAYSSGSSRIASLVTACDDLHETLHIGRIACICRSGGVSASSSHVAPACSSIGGG